MDLENVNTLKKKGKNRAEMHYSHSRTGMFNVPQERR
jgi:hypothetical protein